MLENPLSISMEKQGIHDMFDACFFQTIKPLDNSTSLDYALRNLDFAIQGCQQWLADQKKECEDFLRMDQIEFDIYHSFEMEIHCLEMLKYIYVYRMQYLSRQEIVNECAKIRSVKFIPINKNKE